MTQLTTIKKSAIKEIAPISRDIISNIVVKGDLSSLSKEEKLEYYYGFCERLGLDAATRPFELLRLNGKETLYCTRAGTAQMNRVHNISHKILETKIANDCFITIAEATCNGRTETSTGAVSILGKKGDDMANAIMKSETKAKRRSTLDLMGLGLLDDSEIEAIRGAKTAPIESEPRNLDIEFNNHCDVMANSQNLYELKSSFSSAFRDFSGHLDYQNKLTNIKDSIKDVLNSGRSPDGFNAAHDELAELESGE